MRGAALTEQTCAPCAPGTPSLSAEEVAAHLTEVPGWERVGDELVRTFTFKNYYHTVAFVNALVYIAHREDHHPEVVFGYKTCTVRYSTHSIGGLSMNDFICAAKINALV